MERGRNIRLQEIEGSSRKTQSIDDVVFKEYVRREQNAIRENREHTCRMVKQFIRESFELGRGMVLAHGGKGQGHSV